MEQAAEKRDNIIELDPAITTAYTPAAMETLDRIARKHGWATRHYIQSRRQEIHSTFMQGQWHILVQWSWTTAKCGRGRILNASVNNGPGTRQRMPKEFGLTDKALQWIGDLLYDLGCEQPTDTPPVSSAAGYEKLAEQSADEEPLNAARRARRDRNRALREV